LWHHLDKRLDGSSPRVWGTHHSRETILDERRFIPTGVGNAAMPD